jgi:hypothetical protein
LIMSSLVVLTAPLALISLVTEPAFPNLIRRQAYIVID